VKTLKIMKEKGVFSFVLALPCPNFWRLWRQFWSHQLAQPIVRSRCSFRTIIHFSSNSPTDIFYGIDILLCSQSKWPSGLHQSRPFPAVCHTVEHPRSVERTTDTMTTGQSWWYFFDILHSHNTSYKSW
jgi:hypothetical protein